MDETYTFYVYEGLLRKYKFEIEFNKYGELERITMTTDGKIGEFIGEIATINVDCFDGDCVIAVNVHHKKLRKGYGELELGVDDKDVDTVINTLLDFMERVLSQSEAD